MATGCDRVRLRPVGSRQYHPCFFRTNDFEHRMSSCLPRRPRSVQRTPISRVRLAHGGAPKRRQSVSFDFHAHVSRYLKQFRSLPDKRYYYPNSLWSDMSKRIRPITAPLTKDVKIIFTPAMEDVERKVLAELSAPTVLVFPDWDAMGDYFRSSGCTSTPASMVWGCARAGVVQRLRAINRLRQPCYPPLQGTLDSAQLGSGQSYLGHRVSSRQLLRRKVSLNLTLTLTVVLTLSKYWQS